MNRHITLGLGVIAGAAVGAAAVQGLHAQATPVAYVVAENTLTNQDGYMKEGLRGLEWVILEVENPTRLGIARGFCILAEPGIRHE
jgi:hypothetical protein